MKTKIKVALLVIFMLSIPPLVAATIYFQTYVNPTFKVHHMISYQEEYGWSPVEEIKQRGHGDCSSYALLLLDLLKDEEAYYLGVTQGEEQHAVVLLNGFVMDPTFNCVYRLQNYLKHWEIHRKIPYGQINKVAERRIL